MTIDRQIRKMFNSNKVILCSEKSYHTLQVGQSDYIILLVNGYWVDYIPKTYKQVKKIRDYNNYRPLKKMR